MTARYPGDPVASGIFGAFWLAWTLVFTDLQSRLDIIETNQETFMSGLADLQANITAMQAEWTTFLADVTAALASGDSDSAVEAAAALVAQQTAAMQAADPAAVAPAAPAVPAA